MSLISRIQISKTIPGKIQLQNQSLQNNHTSNESKNKDLLLKM